MSSFLGSSSFPRQAQGGPQLSPVQAQQIKDKIKTSIQQEMANAYATGLVNALTSNCFEKCIMHPSSSMNSVEEKCVTDCAGKFMRSWNLISKSYIARINNNQS